MNLGNRVQILVRLGLTVNQAKAYLALVKLVTATAQEISKASTIAREDVYRVMPALQELGCVERVITSPAIFKAIPLKDVLYILLEHKKQESSELMNRTIALLKEAEKEANLHPAPKQDTFCFVLIPKRETLQKGKMAIETAQTSIDIFTSWKRLLPALFALSETIKKALNRNVKLRFIATSPEKDEPLSKIVQDFTKNPNFKIKYIPAKPSAILIIRDKKEVLLATSAEAGLNGSDLLWSNNPCLQAILQDYFETKWFTAFEKVDIRRRRQGSKSGAKIF